MPATINRPKAAKATPTPSHPGLLVNTECRLSVSNEKLLATYHADCIAWEKRVQAVLDTRRELLDGALDRPIREIIDVARELNSERCDLASQLAELRWRRFAVLPGLVPDYQAAVREADGEYDATLAAVRENYRQLGITAKSMPAAESNHPAAERQIEHRMRQELPVMAAKEAVNRATEQLRVLHSQIGIVPNADKCKLRWPSAPAGIIGGLAKLVGLDSDTPSGPEPAELSPCGSRVVRELGLANSPLLPSHVAAVEQIAGELTGDYSRPLSKASDKQLEKVRPLVAKLPQTQEAKRFLTETANGRLVHTV